MVKLKDVIEVLDIYSGDVEGFFQFYFNLKTDKFIYSSIDSGADDEYLYDDEELYLPFYHEIYSSQIINAFIESIQDFGIQDHMFQIFNGRGKYHRIKEYFYSAGLIDRYYAFKDAYLKNEAIKWCEDHQISYIDT
ncbi:MAG: hypothetical protein KKG64_02785 [Firmicutes bacterium]|nr:hypothetical protein [Bacillota bacterium]